MEKLSIFVDLSKGECSKKFVFDLHDFSGFVVKLFCDHYDFRYGRLFQYVKNVEKSRFNLGKPFIWV